MQQNKSMDYNNFQEISKKIQNKIDINNLKKTKRKYNLKGFKGISRQRIHILHYIIDRTIANIKIKKAKSKITQIKLNSDPHTKSIGLKLKEHNPKLYKELVNKYYNN